MAPMPQRWRVPLALGLSLLLSGTLYALFRDYNLDFTDEGYLWYGVQRTVAGDVPLRDFQSYDPGRYHWCAAFAPLVGDGVLGLRCATAAFQALGLTFALLVATRFTRGVLELAACAALLGLWMFPRHKLFEPALASLAVWFTLRLLEQPSTARHLAAGVFAGLAGYFGRNHGLYSALGMGSAIALLAWRERNGVPWKRALAWGAGIVAGYAPMWGMFLFVPGFARGFLESNRLVLEHGTNLPLPYPWPWRTDWSALDGWDLACQVGMSAAFLLPCIVLPIGLVRTWRTPLQELRARAACVASALVGLPYIHHVAVRSHWGHLAECLTPVLLLTLALCADARLRWLRPLAWGALALGSSLVFLGVHPLLSRFAPGKAVELAECEVHGERLLLPAGKVRVIQNLKALVDAQVPRDQTLFMAPSRPGLYSVLGKVSPTWLIFYYWTASEEEQRDMIAAFARDGVNFVLIGGREIDGDEERRFESSHALVWQHLQRDFEPVAQVGGNRLFRRR